MQANFNDLTREGRAGRERERRSVRGSEKREKWVWREGGGRVWSIGEPEWRWKWVRRVHGGRGRGGV